MRQDAGVLGSGWVAVVPVKRLELAKTRLRGAVPGVPHPTLVLALARDTVAAAAACPAVARVLVVTDDPAAGPALAELGAEWIPDTPAAGINAALRHGARYAAGAPVVALTADLPALRPPELAAALAAAARATVAGDGAPGAPSAAPPGAAPPGAALPSAALPSTAPPGAGPDDAAARSGYVPDAAGTGTVMLAALDGDALDPRFGPGSARAHAAAGAVRLDGDWPTLRRDVDTAADLTAATALGLGRYTAELVGYRGSMQGTVAAFDDATGAGSVLLDDGTPVDFPAEAFAGSGLRLLRVGQRVRLERDETGHISRVTLPTLS